MTIWKDLADLALIVLMVVPLTVALMAWARESGKRAGRREFERQYKGSGGAVFVNGSIGKPSRSATERANEESEALFAWAGRYRREADALNWVTDKQIEDAARKT